MCVLYEIIEESASLSVEHCNILIRLIITFIIRVETISFNDPI